MYTIHKSRIRNVLLKILYFSNLSDAYPSAQITKSVKLVIVYIVFCPVNTKSLLVFPKYLIVIKK